MGFGHWRRVPILDSVTGEHFATLPPKSWTFRPCCNMVGIKGEALRKMTFQERGLLLKKLALYLTKGKKPSTS